MKMEDLPPLAPAEIAACKRAARTLRRGEVFASYRVLTGVAERAVARERGVIVLP